MTDTTPDEPYPSQDGWFIQRELPDGTWAPYAPTHLRSKALERIAISRLQYPDLTHRLIKETTRYAIDNED
jgi:hypothetical protein